MHFDKGGWSRHRVDLAKVGNLPVSTLEDKMDERTEFVRGRDDKISGL